MKKILCVVLFSVFLVSLMAVPSMSQLTVGVEVGNHFQWTVEYSSNATGTLPYQLVGYSIYENASYINRTVTAINDLNVTFTTTVHYDNGTDDTYSETLPAYNETAYNEHGFVIVPANLGIGDYFTETASWGDALNITGIDSVDYGGVARDTGYHFSTTGFAAVVYREWLFDIDTGIVVRALLNATYQGALTAYKLELVQTNVEGWIIPEFPTATVMVLALVAVTASVEIVRRKKLNV